MRAIVVGDIHLSDRPPSMRTDTYAQDTLDELAQAVRIANVENVDVLLLAGDVFHIKVPSRTSHELVQSTAEVLAGCSVQTYVVPGNHDMQHDRIESLPRQPLGTLALADHVELLIGASDTFPVFGLPYLYDWKRDLPKWMNQWQKWVREQPAPLMLTHAPIFPPGRTAPYEYIDAEDWAAAAGNRGSVYYGHIHDVHGTYETSGGMKFCNQGALSRGSLHEATLKRKPAVTLWDSSDMSFTRMEIPHKPAEEIFRLKEKAIIDESEERLDAFIESIEKTELIGLSVEQVIAHAETMGLKPRTLTEIRDVLEEVTSR